MNTLRDLVPLFTPFVPLLIALIWPITILVILCWFREGIRGLIRSVAEAKIGDSVVFKFWQAKSDLLSIERLPNVDTPTASGTPKQISAPSDGKWDKVADLFWLGSDLDWTAQTVLRGAPKERIVHGLTQSYHHCSQLGLSNTVPGKQLASLKSQVEGMQDSALGREWRANFVEQLYAVINGFSGLARERQADFRPSP